MLRILAAADSNSTLGNCRILDLTDDKGDFCTRLLADLGADVVKVEPPEGDPARKLPPFKGHIPHPERGLHFLYFSANKRSITLNLGCRDGKALFERLLARADVVVENFSPGKMEGWGLGYETLKEINPDIVLTSITDFGQTGPHKEYKGSNLVDFAMGGILNRSGDPNMPPCSAPDTLAYHLANMYAAIGTILALNVRWFTGLGQHLDISIQEAVAAVDDYSVARYSHDHVIGQRNGNVTAGLIPTGIYPCKDGHVRVKILTPDVWRAFYDWMGSPEMLADPIWESAEFRGQHPDIVEPHIIEFFSRHKKAEIEEESQRRHISITAVNTPSEFVNDVHEKARGYFVEVEHPSAGRALYPGVPHRFSDTACSIRRPAPLLGEHSVEIYCDELGLSRQDLGILRAAGVI